MYTIVHNIYKFEIGISVYILYYVVGTCLYKVKDMLYDNIEYFTRYNPNKKN